MKNLTIICCTICLFLASFVYAQNTNGITSETSPSSDLLSISQINSLGNQQSRSVSQSNRNVVNIQQIGTNNNARSNSVSGTSDIQYSQFGNNNSIQSFNTVFNAQEFVIQNGNDNTLTNFSFGNVDTSKLNVIQNGNNITFEKFGSNAQTNQLKFNITGNNRTVILRSF